jgi:CelD/BcsL family acetyltransferase involved in cellulose biosynthesis
MNYENRSSTLHDECEYVVLDSAQDFAALAEEWDELYQNAPLATPFQSWAWLYSWWEFYGEGYELRLVRIRHDGLLVGLLPLMLERRAGLGRLRFVGTGLTDYLDVLVREGWETRVPEAAVRGLRQMDGWQVVDLQQLRPEAAAWNIFAEWVGPRTHVWQDSCPVIRSESWDELLTSLSKKGRKMVRRTIRQAMADGIHSKLADVTDSEQAAHRLVALHRELLGERDIVPEHLTRRFESLVATAVSRMVSRGLGGISEFWRGDEVVISNFWVYGYNWNCLGVFILGASQEAVQRYQWSSLCIWDAMNVARSRNSTCLDLLRGEEAYKLRWSSETITNRQMILGRSLAVWAPYAVYHALLSKVKRYAYSEEAPRWTKRAWSTYRILRDKIASRPRA